MRREIIVKAPLWQGENHVIPISYSNFLRSAPRRDSVTQPYTAMTLGG